MSGSEAEAPDPAAGDDEAKDEVAIAQVSMVTIGGIKGFWIPSEQKVDGHVFVLVSKWDTGLAKLVLGKGLARHKSANREQRTINVQWFDEMRSRRHLAVHFRYTCHCILCLCQDRHACYLLIVDFVIFTFVVAWTLKEKMPATCSSDRSRLNPGGQRVWVTLKNHVWRRTTTNGWWGRDGSRWTCRQWMENPCCSARLFGGSAKEMCGWREASRS